MKSYELTMVEMTKDRGDHKKKKKMELRHLIGQTRPDIIGGIESWLNDIHFNNEIFDMDTYSIF